MLLVRKDTSVNVYRGGISANRARGVTLEQMNFYVKFALMLQAETTLVQKWTHFIIVALVSHIYSYSH